MTQVQLAAGLAWLDAWAAPLIADAPFYERNAIKAFFSTNRQTLVEGVGSAVLAAGDPVSGTGSGPIRDTDPDGGQGT
jgi:hypothetical protein